MRLVEGRAEIDDVDGFVARLAAAGDEFGCAVTAFDARSVAGRRHLEAAVERANRAHGRDDAVADDRGIEVLLYAAGRRQIERALEIGVSEGRIPVVVVVDGAAVGKEHGGDGRDEHGAGEGDEAGAAEAIRELIEPADVLGRERNEARIRELFGVSEAELDATSASLEDLVIERVSLLAVEK